jgi:hypothetical protein
MFAKIHLALIHLRHKLLLLFLKLTQSSLTKIQHQVKFWLEKANLSTMLNLK